MILDIIGARASWRDNKLSVAFDVVPELLTHLDLKTGEVFQHENTARLNRQTDRAIAAQLYVTWREKNANGDELANEMRYLPPTKSGESLISLIWQMPDDHLAGFHSLILAGKVPRKATILFARNNLGFGWEPDGSGQTWDNEQKCTVPIENIYFDIPIASLPPPDVSWSVEIPEEADPVFFSDTAKVNFALVRKLSSIEHALGRLTGAVGLIAALVLGLVVSFLRH